MNSKNTRRGFVVFLVASGLVAGTISPAVGYETPELYSTNGEIYISNTWGSASYSRTVSTAKVTKAGFYMGIRARWQEFGVTGWTSKDWNLPTYGGTASVSCYVCQSIRISY